MRDFFTNEADFIQYLLPIIERESRTGNVLSMDTVLSPESSAVMLLLGKHPGKKDFDPCLILTKRSRNVKQSGDLCCPGGRISPRMDAFFSIVLSFPFFPLKKWRYWKTWRGKRSQESGRLALLLAAGLRECFEEIRLNPLNVAFLGPLPNQRLTLFQRVIYPMAAWIKGQPRFVKNWEVEKIVYIPFKELLNPENYCCYRLQVPRACHAAADLRVGDFPCFRPSGPHNEEILWGATYRIVVLFLQSIFGFEPPRAVDLPVFYGVLDEHYYVNASG